MRNQETGEFELVVGNRQLLSGFFIVVLLFAVAFAMGYVVGQNSPRSSKLTETATVAPVQPPDTTRPQPAAAAPANPPEAPPAAPPDTSATAAPPSETPAQPTTQAPRGADSSAASQGVPANPPGPPGSYWQVMAVLSQSDAEITAKAHKDKGFPALLSQGPNNLTRVLVGPYSDTQSMGKAKTDLENAGFRPIRK